MYHLLSIICGTGNVQLCKGHDLPVMESVPAPLSYVALCSRDFLLGHRIRCPTSKLINDGANDTLADINRCLSITSLFSDTVDLHAISQGCSQRLSSIKRRIGAMHGLATILSETSTKHDPKASVDYT